MSVREVIQVADTAELAEEACQRILRAAAEALVRRRVFRIALAGGSTPRAAYQALALRAEATNWSRWQVFFSDERCVPRDHSDSNERMARRALLDHVAIPPANIHGANNKLGTPDAIAADYEARLRSQIPAQPGSLPIFDLVLLGLGEDGHTASLFPRSAVLNERQRWVAPVTDAPKPPAERITLTFPILEAARAVLVLVAGHEKAKALAAALTTQAPAEEIVARRLAACSGQVIWLADRSALAVHKSA